jgi:hypothetical protein
MRKRKDLTLKTQLLVDQMATELIDNFPREVKLNKANIAEQISIKLEFEYDIHLTPDTIEREYLGIYSKLKKSLLF